jgi:hypothetical protein
MTNMITIRVKEATDDVLLDNQAVALLFGVDIAAVEALDYAKEALPREWLPRGKRRAKEAMAHTGSTAMLDSLKYWARQDHNAELEVVYYE